MIFLLMAWPWALFSSPFKVSKFSSSKRDEEKYVLVSSAVTDEKKIKIYFN